MLHGSAAATSHAWSGCALDALVHVVMCCCSPLQQRASRTHVLPLPRLRDSVPCGLVCVTHLRTRRSRSRRRAQRQQTPRARCSPYRTVLQPSLQVRGSPSHSTPSLTCCYSFRARALSCCAAPEPSLHACSRARARRFRTRRCVPPFVRCRVLRTHSHVFLTSRCATARAARETCSAHVQSGFAFSQVRPLSPRAACLALLRLVCVELHEHGLMPPPPSAPLLSFPSSARAAAAAHTAAPAFASLTPRLPRVRHLARWGLSSAECPTRRLSAAAVRAPLPLSTGYCGHLRHRPASLLSCLALTRTCVLPRGPPHC